MFKRMTMLIAAMALSSCAAMFNKTEQTTRFVNAPDKGTTVVSSPAGRVEIKDGDVKAVNLARSRKNVPIRVTCPDGKSHSGQIVTEFDYLVGGALNVLNMPIGWLIDPFSDNAFIYHDVDLSHYCDADSTRKKSSALAPLGLE